jgi:hypothetical protein
LAIFQWVNNSEGACDAMFCAIGAAMVSATWAAQPSQLVLNDMGLGNLVVMSDSDALTVRGMGYSSVRAYGHSWASVSLWGASAGSENGYSSKGKRKAWGSTDSHAGVVIEVRGGHGGGKGGGKSYGGGGGRGGKGGKVGGGSIKVVAFSGGSSRAGRK